jgi:hypothetical protein
MRVNLFETPGCYCDPLAGSLDTAPQRDTAYYLRQSTFELYLWFMPVSTKSNLPRHEALKWNIAKAATEFGVSRDTLRKALNERSVLADSDGLFSTARIVEGLFGSMHIDRLKTQREITERYTLENQRGLDLATRTGFEPVSQQIGSIKFHRCPRSRLNTGTANSVELSEIPW